MADTLTLKLVTPHRLLFSGDVKSFVAPGKNGEFGIMPGHDPWLVALGMGPLTITSATGEEQSFFLNGGFCQIDDDKVDILGEVCEAAADIDLERAEGAKKRAEERIKIAAKDDHIDLIRAEMALHRALYRLDLAGK